jgi:CRISPR-associated protein Csd1
MLHHLVAYADHHVDSEPGFTTREVRWQVELDGNGILVGVIPFGDGRRGKRLPLCPEMHAMNAGGRAHFLIESAQTAALMFKDNEEQKKIESGTERHRFFCTRLSEAAQSVDILKPLASFLDDQTRRGHLRETLKSRRAKPNDWITWRIGGSDPLSDPSVLDWWRAWRARDLGMPASTAETADISQSGGPSDGRVCFLTGDIVTPLPTHPKITGLAGVGGQPSGDVVVGFDKASFSSFGLEQSANAAMSEVAVRKYVDALKELIAQHSHKLAGALVVHWFKERVLPDDDLWAIFYGMESAEQIEATASSAVRRLLEAIRSGERADLGSNHYYAMTISGAAGRVMVRDWMKGPFVELAGNIDAWFSNLDIVARDGNALARNPKFMAVCRALVRDLKDLAPPTVATLWRVAVQCLPVPQSLMAQALARFRADIVRDEPLNHARMGLLRAYFVRNQPGGDRSMTAYLNRDHPESAYHCGRLLAVLANLYYARSRLPVF